jgi:hypothetical protein
MTGNLNERTDDPFPAYTRATCPRPHRWPEGPNEDMGSCPLCWSGTWELRPEGETYGHHLPDCSLPRRHERNCVGGGAGHPPAAKIRGYRPRELPPRRRPTT